MIGYGSCDWSLFRVNDNAGEIGQVGPAAADNRRLEPRKNAAIGADIRQEKEGGLWGRKISGDAEAVYPEINAVVGTDGSIYFAHEAEIPVDYPLVTDQVDRDGQTYSTLGAGQSKQRLYIPLDNDIFDALLTECHAAAMPSWAIAFEGARTIGFYRGDGDAAERVWGDHTERGAGEAGYYDLGNKPGGAAVDAGCFTDPLRVSGGDGDSVDQGPL